MSKLKKKLSYISVPSQIISSLSSSSLESLLVSPKNSSKANFSKKYFTFNSYKNPRFWFLTLFLVGLFGMLTIGFNLDPLIPFSPYPCFTTNAQGSFASNDKSQMSLASNNDHNGKKDEILKGVNESQALMAKGFGDSDEQSEFGRNQMEWGLCRVWISVVSIESKVTGIVKDRRKYLLVVVSGGMNHQRNQIVDFVVIARILGAALVVPILQVNVIWGDESEFSDIFDFEHFKRLLSNDVRVVSSLPSTHIMTRPVEEKRTPLHISHQWIRARYLRRLNRERVLLLRGLDSRLSKDLPSDLLKLRCKVAFHALRFAPPILQLGNKLAERMRSKGPYLALHLRMEKDVWVRTGCLPGPEYDEMISNERKQRPELLTARSNMTYHERKLAGLCPLNTMEVTRLLKALGTPKNARIYWAGGEPLGGKDALLPLITEFPHLYNREDLALPAELEPFANKASFMAATDYIVSENSDVFMPSHGGNVGHAIQGQRAYAGHKKYITPNKRHMLPYFLKQSSTESQRSCMVNP